MMKSKTNGRLLALFLFQYSILIPAMRFISPTILVALTSIIILACLFITNASFKFSGPIIISCVVIIFIFLFKTIIGHIQFSLLLSLCSFIFPVLFMCMFSFDIKSFMEYSVIMSRITFVVLAWVPFVKSFYSYMRFGYGMLPVVVFAYIDLFYFKRKNNTQLDKNKKYISIFIDIVLIIVGAIEVVLFGPRGATFALILLFVLDRFVLNKENFVANALIIVSSALIVLNLGKILSLINEFLSDINMSSYAIMKYEKQLNNGIAAASSGRDKIYGWALDSIEQSPIIGNPISVDEYVHNLFLQVFQDLGIVGFIFIIGFTLYCIYMIGSKKFDKNDRLAILALFSLAYGRLMFSSVVWRRPEFWMLLGFVVCITYGRRKMTVPAKKYTGRSYYNA